MDPALIATTILQQIDALDRNAMMSWGFTRTQALSPGELDGVSYSGGVEVHLSGRRRIVVAIYLFDDLYTVVTSRGPSAKRTVAHRTSLVDARALVQVIDRHYNTITDNGKRQQ